MNIEDRIKYAEEKGRESAKQLFKEKPQDLKEELERETVLGTPESLVEPENKNE